MWTGDSWTLGDIPPSPEPSPPPEPTLAERRTEAITAIKAEANRRILARYPDWKQRNMTAQSVALLDKGRENWDDTDREVATQARAVWDWIRTIRAHSDALEARVAAMTARALSAFDPGDDSHWSDPEPA